MRELKFNAIYQEKYYYWHNEQDRGIILKFILSPKIYIGIQLFQFTGELDINKREIYNGDILKSNYGNYEVVFYNGGFGVLVEKECGFGEYPHEIEEVFYNLNKENDAWFNVKAEDDLKPSCVMAVVGHISVNKGLLGEF